MKAPQKNPFAQKLSNEVYSFRGYLVTKPIMKVGAVLILFASTLLVCSLIFAGGKSYIASKIAGEEIKKEERRKSCQDRGFATTVYDYKTREPIPTGCEEFQKPVEQPPKGKKESSLFLNIQPVSFLPPLRPAPRRDGGTPEQQTGIQYAWDLSGGDEQFITMIEAESRWNYLAVERLQDDSDGDGIGYCQVDRRYWPEIYYDKRFRTDWRYQIRVCLNLWRNDVVFYGAKKNSEMIPRFWWAPQRDT